MGDEGKQEAITRLLTLVQLPPHVAEACTTEELEGWIVSIEAAQADFAARGFAPMRATRPAA